MANQPTKYRKFVVGAASAALVASAVAPVAFAAEFTDVKDNNSHKAAIDALSDAGVISGYPDGTFQPNKTLTRSDVVKLMGKWLVAEGYKVPTDYKTKPRFSDLKTTSNDELLKMSALVYDNGLFVGKPDGTLDPAGDITRENMAIVLVRAFDRVYDVDLVSYVKGQEFKKDVTDLGKAKAEARPAIDVLDFFDITNPAAPEFNPKNTTTRGQFASFLYKTTQVDFDKVIGGGVVAPGVATIKAINATTVEVTMKDAVTNINSLNFSIDGLTVSNAAVKQTDNKTVVLTTAVQKGGEKYTIKLDDKAIGSFTGISAVVPAGIKLGENSKQSQVGKEVILTADIGVKEANVPVTFNVSPNGNLNKSQIIEVMTNAEGIATLSYTQYSNGVDHVAVYPTGAPTVRDFATVYWGVQPILVLTEDEAGTTVANGTKKTYTVTYLDPQTGAPVRDAELNVTFKENVNVDFQAISKATVTNPKTGVTKTPYQAKNGNHESLTVKTDSQGQASFVVSGTNTEVTPMVFVDGKSTITNQGNDKFDPQELVVTANKVVFSGAQLDNKLEITAVGDAEAAAGVDNGRVYKVKVTDPKTNKVYAGGTVNVALDELMDRNMSTNSKAQFANVKDSTALTLVSSKYGGGVGQQGQLKLDSKGEASFVLYGDNNEQGTPVIWIDQNNSVNTQTGVLEDGEPSAKAPITYFQTQRVINGKLVVTNSANKEVKDFPQGDQGTFTFDLTNQSGKVFGNYSGKVTFEVRNTGGNALTLQTTSGYKDQDGNDITGPTEIEVGGSITVATTVTNGKADIKLSSTKATSAAVTASAVTADNFTNDARNQNKYVSAETFNTTFSGAFIPANFTGEVLSVDKTAKTVTLEYGNSKYTISYKDAEYYYNTSSVQSTFEYFESELSIGDLVTFTKAPNADSKNKFDIIKDGTVGSAISAVAMDSNGNGNFETVTLTFSDNVVPASLASSDFKVDGVAFVGTVATNPTNSKEVVLTFDTPPTSVGKVTVNNIDFEIADEIVVEQTISVSNGSKPAAQAKFETDLAAATSGSTVTLTGDVTVEDTVELPAGVTIDGAGKVLTVKSTGTGATTSEGLYIPAGLTSPVTIKNLTVVGTHGDNLIEIYSSANLENVRVNNGRKAGIYVNANSNDITVKFDYVLTSGNAWAGVGMVAQATNNITADFGTGNNFGEATKVYQDVLKSDGTPYGTGTITVNGLGAGTMSADGKQKFWN